MILFLLNYLTRRTTIDYHYSPPGPQLRTVLRRAFGNFRGNGPAIGFIAGKEGLIARSIFGDVAVECRLPGERPTETLWLPFEFLADVGGKNDEPVELEATGDDQVSVQWRTGNVPQIVNYDAKEPLDADKFPVLPTAFTANPRGALAGFGRGIGSHCPRRRAIRHRLHPALLRTAPSTPRTAASS